MADAYIRTVITARDDASGVVKNFGASVGNIAKGVAIGTLAVQGITLALNKFKDAAMFAVQSAGDFEQNRIAFETMLGSADKAKKMLKDVSDFAAKTPFELPEVVTGAKQLLAYNIEADKIIPTFKALGNIAAGVGKDKLPQMILAFGQVRAATRLTGMELRQFTEAGVPMLSTLAKQMGKTEAQIQDMVSAGQIGFPEVEKAIFGMSQEGGKFFNLMERQSTTFQFVLSNLKDNFGRMARDIIGINDQGEIRQGSIFYYLRIGAQAFLDWINANKDKIINFFNTLVSFGLQMGQAIGDAIGIIQTKWGQLTAYLQENQFVQHSFEVIKLLIEQIYGHIQNELMPALAGLAKALGPEFINNMKIVGAALVAAFVGLLTIIDAVIYGLSQILKLTTWIQEKFNKLGEAGQVLKGIFAGGPILNPLGFLTTLKNMFRAEGGPVSAGQPYIVGERGPELMIPRSSGQVVPNRQLGGAVTINIAANVGVYAGSEMEKRKLAGSLLDALQDVAKSQNSDLASLLSGGGYA